MTVKQMTEHQLGFQSLKGGEITCRLFIIYKVWENKKMNLETYFVEGHILNNRQYFLSISSDCSPSCKINRLFQGIGTTLFGPAVLRLSKILFVNKSMH